MQYGKSGNTSRAHVEGQTAAPNIREPFSAVMSRAAPTTPRTTLSWPLRGKPSNWRGGMRTLPVVVGRDQGKCETAGGEVGVGFQDRHKDLVWER